MCDLEYIEIDEYYVLKKEKKIKKKSEKGVQNIFFY